MALETAPFTKLYRETPRHPDYVHILNELGEYFTERALTPIRKRDGSLTLKGKRRIYIGEKVG
jgi:hypothetical protein